MEIKGRPRLTGNLRSCRRQWRDGEVVREQLGGGEVLGGEGMVEDGVVLK
jgi:hypothetical protein